MYQGEGLVAWAKGLGGSVVTVGLIFWGVSIFVRKAWSEFVGLFAAAVVVVGLVFFTEQSIGFLKWIWGLVIGGGA